MRKAQLEIADLKEELRSQKLKYTELEQSYKTLKTKAHNEKSKGKDSTISTNDELIGLYARRFGVMNEIFVPKDVFLQQRPLNISSDDPDRWEDDEKTKACVIAELYEEIPVSLHDMLEKTSSFRDTVQCQSNFMQSATSTNLNVTSSPTLFQTSVAPSFTNFAPRLQGASSIRIRIISF